MRISSPNRKRPISGKGVRLTVKIWAKALAVVKIKRSNEMLKCSIFADKSRVAETRVLPGLFLFKTAARSGHGVRAGRKPDIAVEPAAAKKITRLREHPGTTLRATQISKRSGRIV